MMSGFLCAIIKADVFLSKVVEMSPISLLCSVQCSRVNMCFNYFIHSCVSGAGTAGVPGE